MEDKQLLGTRVFASSEKQLAGCSLLTVYLWLGQQSEIIFIPFKLSGGLAVEGGSCCLCWLVFLLKGRFLGVGVGRQGDGPALGHLCLLAPIKGPRNWAQHFSELQRISQQDLCGNDSGGYVYGVCEYLCM